MAGLLVPSPTPAVPGGGMTLIQEVVTSASTGVSFTSISGTYKQLLLVWSGLSTSDNSDFALRFNNDSGGNYAGTGFGVADTSLSSFTTSTATSVRVIVTNTVSPTLGNSGKGYVSIDNYASASKLKTWSASINHNSSNKQLFFLNGIYNSTSAITSVDIVRTGGSGTFSNATNTSIRLYGVS